MKVVIQRVTKGICVVNKKITGKIESGLIVFAGFFSEDNSEDLNYITKKISNIRLFEDNNGKIHYSVKDKMLQILLIPQFTLFANTRKGNRPDFIQAMKPDLATSYFDKLQSALIQSGCRVETGVFGADMKIEAHNDGPFTIIIDSKER